MKRPQCSSDAHQSSSSASPTGIGGIGRSACAEVLGAGMVGVSSGDRRPATFALAATPTLAFELPTPRALGLACGRHSRFRAACLRLCASLAGVKRALGTESSSTSAIHDGIGGNTAVSYALWARHQQGLEGKMMHRRGLWGLACVWAGSSSSIPRYPALSRAIPLYPALSRSISLYPALARPDLSSSANEAPDALDCFCPAPSAIVAARSDSYSASICLNSGKPSRKTSA